MHYMRPCLRLSAWDHGWRKEAHFVQRLVIYARAEHRYTNGPALCLQLTLATLENNTLFPYHEVHLVHQQEHGSIGGVLLERVETVAVVLRVFGGIARADFEDVDEHPDMLKDGRALCGEVRVHERVLSSAVPEVEYEVPKEPDVVLLDINGRAEARGERRGVVGAALFAQQSGSAPSVQEQTHKIRERMDVFPLPDAPMRRTWRRESAMQASKIEEKDALSSSFLTKGSGSWQGAANNNVAFFPARRFLSRMRVRFGV
jgi:hypothetical protein